MYEDDSHLLIDDGALERAEELKRGDHCDKCESPYKDGLFGDSDWTLVCSNADCRYELDLVEYVSDNRGGDYDD